MPKYKNVGNTRVVLSGQPIEPGDTITTVVEYDLTGLNVIKVDVHPIDNRIIYSQSISANTTVVIPLKDSLNHPVEKFLVRIYVESGEISVAFDSSSNLPVLNLYKGAQWRQDCWSRLMNQLIISFNVSGVVWVTVERLS